MVCSPVAIIIKYFPQLTGRQVEQFAALDSLYREWNNRINVISRRDIDDLYEHHILHSLSIARIVGFASGAEILDVGTGGGFPGIPLAILFPDTNFLLIDSIGKKLKVVDAIAEALQLKNVHTMHIRAEELARKFDFVISRAVTSLPNFIPWISRKFTERQLHDVPNGAFFLKGGDLSEELANYRHIATVYPVKDIFEEPFFEEKKIVYIPA
jgi:16S rRNA (guanine527-N7)-methyltransferase